MAGWYRAGRSMTHKDISWVMVDIIEYRYLWPGSANEDAVYGFTHSLEVNSMCADMLPPYVVTPVEKSNLERAFAGYAARNDISADYAAMITAWLDQMPEEIAIIERKPHPFG